MARTPDEVLDHLADGPWRLTSLSTRRGPGTYLVAFGDARDRFGYAELRDALEAAVLAALP